MKKLLFIATMFAGITAYAQEKQTAPPAGNALVGDFYGAPVAKNSEKAAITTAKLQSKLKDNGKVENVAVKGKIVEVCPKKGCWATVQTENNERFFVKMKDYAFFVPTALEGKNVILEGNAEVKTLSVDEAKHYAEDAKRPQAEIDAITTPQKEIRFMASGIKVVK